MMNTFRLLCLSTVVLISSCTQSPSQKPNTTGTHMKDKVTKSPEEWKKELTAEQYRVMRDHGTERAFTGKFWDHHEPGTYTCAACGSPLFDSETKFDSGTGWPSYYAPQAPGAVEESKDMSLGMVRSEVHCARCGGHLGHVFNDGPKPTGLRYCINSVSLDFVPEKK